MPYTPRGAKNLAGQCTVNPGLTVWGLKSLHDSSVILFIMPQHTSNQTWMLPILQPVCSFSAGMGGRVKEAAKECSDGDSISTVVVGPQVEQIWHARAGKRRRLHRRGKREKKRERQVQTADTQGL